MTQSDSVVCFTSSLIWDGLYGAMGNPNYVRWLIKLRFIAALGSHIHFSVILLQYLGK